MLKKILQSLLGNLEGNDSPSNPAIQGNNIINPGRTTPDNPTAFGYNCAWMAIKNASPESIAGKLNISNLQVSNWSSGIDAAYKEDGKVFITPLLDNWILVIGTSLPDPGDTSHQNHTKGVLEFLSREFGEAQFFCTMRIVDYHCWAKAVNGRIVRGYCYCGDEGEATWNEGDKTQEEWELDFKFFDEKSSEAQADENYFEREDLRYPGEEDVMKISKRWSIDTSFESITFPPSTGFIGTIIKKG